MAFQKGSGKRHSYKSAALEIDGSLMCRKKYASAGLRGFVVYRGEIALSSAASAEEAWYKAWQKLPSNKELKRDLLPVP